MSITDELREWVTGAKPAVVDGCSISVGTMTYGCKKALLAIADRIDAAHKRAVMSTMNDALHHANDESMAELGWVRLPKDADGEPIHIGDVMDGTCPSGKHVNGTVSAIGDGVFWLSNVQFSLKPEYMHHHEPTVEDVLRQVIACANNGTHVHGALDTEQIVAEYAAKLRLAEGEDE